AEVLITVDARADSSGAAPRGRSGSGGRVASVVVERAGGRRAGGSEHVPARLTSRNGAAHHLLAIRQCALRPRQPERTVRPGADAASAQLSHRRDPADPATYAAHLAHWRQYRERPDGPLSGPQRTGGEQHVPLLHATGSC